MELPEESLFQPNPTLLNNDNQSTRWQEFAIPGSVLGRSFLDLRRCISYLATNPHRFSLMISMSMNSPLNTFNFNHLTSFSSVLVHSPLQYAQCYFTLFSNEKKNTNDLPFSYCMQTIFHFKHDHTVTIFPLQILDNRVVVDACKLHTRLTKIPRSTGLGPVVQLY